MQSKEPAEAPATRFAIDPLLSIGDLKEITTLRPSALYAKMKEGTFPPGVLLSKRCRRWRRSEVVAWMEAL